jgi:hypothetical protein
MPGKPIAPTPWKPADLPTLRAAYSDRTAALMAYLAAFAYDTRIQAKGVLQVPQELSTLGFNKLTAFHNGLTDGWAYIAEGTDSRWRFEGRLRLRIGIPTLTSLLSIRRIRTGDSGSTKVSIKHSSSSTRARWTSKRSWML